jgi:hypothetical protein
MHIAVIEEFVISVVVFATVIQDSGGQLVEKLRKYIYIYIYVYVYECTCIHTCAYVCRYICIHVYIYMYTYIHTCIHYTGFGGSACGEMT